MGLIKNKSKASQIIDYEGLLPPPLAPIDIDGLIEYHNKAYIIIEVKQKDKVLPYGQRIAIERMIDDFYAAGKRAVAIVVDHTEEDTKKPIYAKECKIRVVYYDNVGRWKVLDKDWDLRSFVRAYIEWVDKD